VKRVSKTITVDVERTDYELTVLVDGFEEGKLGSRITFEKLWKTLEEEGESKENIKNLIVSDLSAALGQALAERFRSMLEEVLE